MSLRTHESQTGISLIELLVGMIILSIVTTMIIMTWTSLQNSYSSTVKGAEARNTARDAMERMRREIRDIQPPAGRPAGSLKPAQTRFDSPRRSMTRTNGTGRILLTRYFYVYDGTKTPGQWCVSRQRDTDDDGSLADDPTMVIARNVVNGLVPSAGSPTPVFRYFGVDGASTTDSPTSPRCRSPSSGSQPEPFTDIFRSRDYRAAAQPAAAVTQEGRTTCRGSRDKTAAHWCSCWV